MTNETTLTASTYQDHFNEFTPSVFKNPLFGNLTVLKDTNDNLWFIGVEVARILGYKDPKAAVRKLVTVQNKKAIHLDSINNRGVNRPPIPMADTTSPSPGYPYRTIISEQGLIELINRSDLNNPVIRQFKDWVNNVVVQMRKYGFSASDAFINELDNMNDQQLRQLIMQQREALQNRQEAVEYYDEAMNFTQNTITISQIADSYGMTAQALNSILQAIGFHYPVRKGWVIKDKYKDQGLVTTRRSEVQLYDSGEHVMADIITGYTEKGRQKIDQLMVENGYRTATTPQYKVDPQDWWKDNPYIIPGNIPNTYLYAPNMPAGGKQVVIWFNDDNKNLDMK